MTYDDVDRACAVLEARGMVPSGNTVLAHLKARGLPGSKRTVLKYLKLRRPAAPGAPPAPAEAAVQTHATWQRWAALQVQQAQQQAPLSAADDAPVSHALPVGAVPLDPVAAATAVLGDAEGALDRARDNMDQAVLSLWLSRGVILEGLRYGGYADTDPAREQVQAEANAAMGHYRECVQAVDAAHQALAQAERQYLRAQQETWVRRHRPDLVDNLAHWQDKLRTAPSDWAHAEAKKNVQTVLASYEREVHLAPVSVNGTTP